ncbi:MAG: hypothetical protein C5S52_01160 [ANME-2 cluster archaeon]|nr:hypothetical protein [ANME-2 cluster archaeon]
MSTEMQTKVQASPAQNFTPVQTYLLQRKSALYNTPGLVEDSGRDKEKLTLQRSSVDQAGTTTVPRFGHDFSKVSVHSTWPGMIQAKLKINEPGDIYEQEADRVAEQVIATPAHPDVIGAPPCIQCFSGQSTGGMDSVPASVDQALSSPGRPLEPALKQDMEQRFGHDFSRVRVHSGTAAEQSALEVNANAYTVGHNIGFGAGQYAPGTREGQRLLAHELTHVVQQFGPTVVEDSGSQIRQQFQRMVTVSQIGDLYERNANLVADTGVNIVGAMHDIRPKRFHRDISFQSAGAAGKRFQRQSTRRTGFGSTEPKTECDPPVCFPYPSDIFGFEFDSDQLRPEEEERLKTSAMFMAPDESVFILGYASVEGPENYNMNLACHRANKVKEILQQETLSTIRSIHAIGETNAFGPELAQNRVVQVFIHRPPPPPALPTPTTEPEPKPETKPETKPKPTLPPLLPPSKRLNCGCTGKWNVSRTTQLGPFCQCWWYCAPPPGISTTRRPTVGCGSSFPKSSGPPNRATLGVMSNSRGGLESGDKCNCYTNNCMTNVGLRSKKPG